MQTELFDYLDYREYLADVYEELKRTTRSFSYRYFSKKVGLGSPNYLKLVIDGDRNLSLDMARRFAEAFKLNKQEVRFFVTLVAMNQAQTGTERTRHYEELCRIPRYRKTKTLQRQQYDYYSHWYCIAVRELVALDTFVEDPAWVAKTVRPAITEQEARFALDLLQSLKMVVRDDNGRLVQAESLVSTGPHLQSMGLRRFHHDMLGIAAGVLDRHTDPAEREFGGVTLRLSADQIGLLKRRMYEMRQEVLQLEGQGSGEEAVYHFAFQLFPLSET